MAQHSEKRPRGRPARPIPDRIDASPEAIAEAFLSVPADHKWQYPKQQAKNKQHRSDGKAK